MKNLIKKNYGKATILVLLLAVIAIIIKIIVLKYQPNFVIIPNGLRIITAENMGNTWGMGESNLLNVIISNVIVLGIILKFIQFQKDRIDTKTFHISGGDEQSIRTPRLWNRNRLYSVFSTIQFSSL